MSINSVLSISIDQIIDAELPRINELLKQNRINTPNWINTSVHGQILSERISEITKFLTSILDDEWKMFLWYNKNSKFTNIHIEKIVTSLESYGTTVWDAIPNIIEAFNGSITSKVLLDAGLVKKNMDKYIHLIPRNYSSPNNKNNIDEFLENGYVMILKKNDQKKKENKGKYYVKLKHPQYSKIQIIFNEFSDVTSKTE